MMTWPLVGGNIQKEQPQQFIFLKIISFKLNYLVDNFRFKIVSSYLKTWHRQSNCGLTWIDFSLNESVWRQSHWLVHSHTSCVSPCHSLKIQNEQHDTLTLTTVKNTRPDSTERTQRLKRCQSTPLGGVRRGAGALRRRLEAGEISQHFPSSSRKCWCLLMDGLTALPDGRLKSSHFCVENKKFTECNYSEFTNGQHLFESWTQPSNIQVVSFHVLSVGRPAIMTARDNLTSIRFAWGDHSSQGQSCRFFCWKFVVKCRWVKWLVRSIVWLWLLV